MLIKKNKPLIIALSIIALIFVLLIVDFSMKKYSEYRYDQFLLEQQQNKQKGYNEKSKEILEVMKKWSNCENVWIKDEILYDEKEIFENYLISQTNDIIKSIKNDHQKLVFFLNRLDYYDFESEILRSEISDITFSIEDKLLAGTYTDLDYYYVTPITVQDVMEYVKENGSKTVHTTNNAGGYYASKEDSSEKRETGIPRLYRITKTKYYGDFKHVESYQQFESIKDSHMKSYYYKDIKIAIDPFECSLYCSDKYLFAVKKNRVYIVDTDEEMTYDFNLLSN